jgi:predicted phage terminase large subunit-like protein
MELSPQQITLLDTLSRTDLRYFVPRVFRELNPGQELLWNWHLDVLCWDLMRTMPKSINPTPDRPLRRLIINVPPRSLKSIICSISYSAFILGHFPHHQIIGASHSANLSQRMNLDVIKILNAPWYKRLFPYTSLAKESEKRLTTTRYGHRLATSVGGSVIGEGGDTIIADDLVNASEIKSVVERETANTWFDESLYTRQNNQKSSNVVVIMQRLAENDLTGHLLAKNKFLTPDSQWKLRCLPAKFVDAPERPIKYYSKIYHPKEGELLHPDRLGESELAQMRANLGGTGFAGQYQQSPVSEGGNIVNIGWFRRYDSLPPVSEIISTTQSWDTAVKDGKSNDYSVCTTWYETKNGHYLAHVFALKGDYPTVKKAMHEEYARYLPDAVLVEDKASGQQLLQDFRKESQLPIFGITPEKDKQTRLAAVSPLIESGRVWLPTSAPWLADLEHQINLFPNGQHDDMVDSLSQYLNWKRNRSVMARIRVLSTDAPAKVSDASTASTVGRLEVTQN